MFKKFCDNKIGFKPSIQFIKRKNKILIANTNNGGGLFITDECYEIINNAIKEHMTFGDLIECIEENESKEYMTVLLERLYCIRAWDFESDEILSEYFEIDIDITNECNLRCKHCCVSAGDNLQGEDLPHEKVMEMVEKVINMNPAQISISGGEPLVRADFREIILFIREKYDKPLILMTNATLIDDSMAEFIANNFNVVDVSIDGGDEKSCAILRGAGTFEKSINGIRRLQEKGMNKISASMVLTKDNIYAKDDFLELCKKMNIKPCIRGLDLSGRAQSGLEKPKNYRKRHSKDEIKESFICNKTWEHIPQIMACQGAKIEFQIGHTGNIYPCGALLDEEFHLGNVFEVTDLKRYLEDREFEKGEGYRNFEKYKSYRDLKCKNCDFNILCFSCVSEIKNKIQDRTVYEDCDEQSFFFGLYWEDYEGN
ncbi:MAG: radical SAM protein [Roseburia sp.]|nr:radical SAM protein [Roseburia sp.]